MLEGIQILAAQAMQQITGGGGLNPADPPPIQTQVGPLIEPGG